MDERDLEVVRRLRQIALDVVRREAPTAHATGDFALRFHRPPFNSMDHLHLHALAPASAMTWRARVAFWIGAGGVGSSSPWACDVDDVVARLEVKHAAAEFESLEG